MKPKNILYIFSLFILASIYSSCKKQIAIEPPITQLVTTNVFNDNGTATAAELGIYGQMNTFPYLLHSTTAFSADELLTYATDLPTKDNYFNSLIASDGGGGNNLVLFWVNSYKYIYQLNAILENLQQATNVSPKVKQQLTGEAEFMRAYFYFYLVNLYGDVPLAITTDYKVNSTLARSPKAQVYQQIVQDLITAQTALSQKYVDATDTTATVDRIRPTVWAADALLARAYLYMGAGHFLDAETQATNVINNSSTFSLPTDLNAVFKKNSSEAIWQLANYNSSSTPSFTPDGNSFILTAPPTGSNSTVSTQLLGAFENNDQRKIKWIGVYSNGASSWNYPAKYKDNAITASSTSEYTMILRLAEQYLIRAEARAQQGNTTGALGDLNIIRNRAGLGNYAGATDQASLITAISHERQVELFAEGDRWFNLKRTGTIDAVMGLVTPQKGGGTWNSNQQLYPIPPSEIQVNFNLKQNIGY